VEEFCAKQADANYARFRSSDSSNSSECNIPNVLDDGGGLFKTEREMAAMMFSAL